MSSSSKAESRRRIVKAIAYIYAGLVSWLLVFKCFKWRQAKVEADQKTETGNEDDQKNKG